MSQEEEQPLLEGTKKAADLIILLPWGEATEGKTVSADDILEDFIVDPEAGKNLPKLTQLSRNNKGKKVALDTVIRTFLADLSTWMPTAGIMVEPFLSQDEDELIVRLTLNKNDVESGEQTEEVEKFYAEKFGVRVQLDKMCSGNAKPSKPGWPFGCQQEWKDPSEAPYITYARAVEQELREETPELTQIFRKYYLRSKSGSMFRGVDRIRMVRKAFGRTLNMEAMQAAGVVLGVFPVHYKHVLDDLKYNWASMTLVCDCRDGPLERIRNYFGEGTAFFVAWMNFTIKWLVPLAFIGLVLKTLTYLVPENHKRYKLEIDICCTLFLTSWAALYLVFWRRTEHYLRVLWDTKSTQKTASVRVDFVGVKERDPLDLTNTRIVRSAPKALAARIFSVFVTTVFLVIASVGTRIIFKERANMNILIADLTGQKQLAELLVPYNALITNLLISVEIAILNFIWQSVVPMLLWLENHRTNFSYINSCAWLNFSFQAFNSYNSFILIAFFMRYSTLGCVPTKPKSEQTGEDCIVYLQTSLLTTFGSLGAMSVVSASLPRVQMWWAMRSEAKKLELQGKQQQQLSFMERQAKMFDYRIQDQITDVLDLVIALGYVFLFGGVSPAVAFISLLVFLLRLRCHAWKLCNVMRRPFPDATDGLGAWNNILELLSWLGLATCVLVPIMNYQWIDDHIPASPEEAPPSPDRKPMEKMLLFFLAEHIIMMIRVMIMTITEGQSPEGVQIEAKRDFMTEKLIATEGETGLRKVPVVNPAWRSSEDGTGNIGKLDMECDEWEHVEKADEEIEMMTLKRRLTSYRDNVC
mmetsp:Transcript_35540/g.81421  ORF Transcript_35540/g.81421 Transcript_35540/m.81421 type:complete len:811 (-) Transcript_35540:138-2570(-)